MTITPGDFWVAEILFTDGSAAKKRPILILWLDDQDVVVAAVTSASPPNGYRMHGTLTSNFNSSSIANLVDLTKRQKELGCAYYAITWFERALALSQLQQSQKAICFYN